MEENQPSRSGNKKWCKFLWSINRENFKGYFDICLYILKIEKMNKKKIVRNL